MLKVAGAIPIEDTVGVGSAFQAFAEGRLADDGLDTQLRSLVNNLVDAVGPGSRSAA